MDSTPPPHAAADWTIDQNWSSYSAEEHQRWTRLHERQMQILPGRACDAFMDGLSVLDLHGEGIPEFEALNKQLQAISGWTIVAVPGLIPDSVFFEHLANRRFPAGNFIRSEAEFEYIEAPDVFHDIFGHVPMLTNQVFADYMQAYGQGGLRAMNLNSLDALARLYWYTVEFGLIDSATGPRIYGAGILSSPAESCFCLESPSPNRVGFDLLRVMQTRYRIDDFQETYFEIGDFNDLFHATSQDFAPLYRALEAAPNYAPGEILASDAVIQMGDHSYTQHSHLTATR
ncbi:MAG: phenylalanine 4-monooxygenase [Alphaproteobacteria bacterium PA1]|nr:MAG: phenylalanine 4-monooxygenase [Alphaproteobacteria bacterium PA1]